MGNDIKKDKEEEKKVQPPERITPPPTPSTAPPSPPDLEEMLKQAPTPLKQLITTQMGIQLSGGPPINPIFQKISPQHIDKLLDYTHEDEVNNYKLTKEGRWFNLAIVMVSLIVFVFLVVFLSKDNPILLTDILRILVVFAGGFGSGYGFKAYKEKRK